MRLAALLLAGSVQVVAAEPAMPRPDDKAEADKLFERARDLMTHGDRVGACKLFDQSFAKDPRAVGTMLNLGLCREEGGAVASAMRFYAEARDRAHDQSLHEHQEAAERKLAMLAPRVPHLKIILSNTPPGTRILVDDLVLSIDQLGDVPVDPGSRTIVVTAPGKVSFETKVVLAEAEHREVRVPSLEGAKTVILERNNRRLYGKIGVAGGAGLGMLAIGLGLYARHIYWAQFPDGAMDGHDASDPKHHCFTLDGLQHCDPTGTSRLHTAKIVAGFGTGIGIASAIAIGVGAYLWITGPANVTVDVAPDHAAVTASLRF